MKTIVLLFAVSLTLHKPIKAQQSIQGNVVFLNHKPASYATALLLHAKDTSLAKAVICDKDGLYQFDSLVIGDYIIAASFSGYKQVYSNKLSVQANDHSIVSALTFTEQTNVLTDVTITAKKPLLEQKIDRLVINVANSITSAGNTALEILERSPGVIVDHQNNAISMDGKNGVVIMLNGKLSHMPVSAVVQMLSGMTAGNIEKIELITTPPSSLDAEGNAGYINIVLKENNNYGTNGSYTISAGYGRGWVTSASINLNHRKGKINIYGDLSYARVELPHPIKGYTKISNNGTITENYFDTDRTDTIPNINARFGADWQLSKRTIAGVLFSGYYNGYRMSEHNLNRAYVNNMEDTTIHLANSEKNYWHNYAGNINLQHNFDDNDKLQLNLDYIYYTNDQPVNYSSSYFDNTGKFIYNRDFRSGKKTPIHFTVMSADYSKKLSSKINVDVGVKQTLSTFSNNISFENFRQNKWIKDNALSAIYKLKEDYNAAYLSLNITINKNTEGKAGLRYEHTNSNLGTEQIKDIVDRDYTNFFPSIFISHKITENSSLNFSYSKRITRPTFNDLAPFTYYANVNTLVTGNPALQPSLSDNFKAGYTFKRYLFSILYANEKDAIAGFQAHADSVLNKIKISAENLKSLKTLSAVLAIPLDVTKWWSMQYNITGAWQQANAIYLKEPVTVRQAYYTINSVQRFTLPRSYAIELVASYRSPQLNGISVVKASGSFDAGIRKKLKGQAGSLSLNGTNIFNTAFFAVYTDLPAQNLVNDIKIYYGRPTIKLSYTRNFGKEKLKEKRQRSTGAEDEKGRVQ